MNTPGPHDDMTESPCRPKQYAVAWRSIGVSLVATVTCPTADTMAVRSMTGPGWSLIALLTITGNDNSRGNSHAIFDTKFETLVCGLF